MTASREIVTSYILLSPVTSLSLLYFYRECLRWEYLNVRYRSFIFLVSVSLRLPWSTAIREWCKTNLFCGTEKVFESILHLYYAKVSPAASALDFGGVLENSLSTSVEATAAIALCEAAHLHTNCLSYNLSLLRVSCKIHPILILIEFLKFLMHTLIRSSRKLSPE